MSGPKVVRIVTREEMFAVCERLLAHLDTAADEWERIGRRNGTVDEQDVRAIGSRKEALRKLLASDKFADLQKQVPAEISYLTSDTQVRLKRAADAEVEKRKRARRLLKSAETLLRAVERSGSELPAEVLTTLRSLHSPREHLEEAIGKALKLLPAALGRDGISDRQRETARRLGEGERRVTFSEWLARQRPDDDEGILQSVDRQLAELIALGGPEAASEFESRAVLIEREPSSPRKRLLADSLVLEIASALREAKEHARLRSEMVTLRQELDHHETEQARSLAAQLDSVLRSPNLSEVLSLIERSKAFLAREAAATASLSRRRAILAGLSALGYEVREGMETAWVENGRVVMRKASQPDYGVEIGGNPDGRLQMRTVAFGVDGGSRDAQRDVEMETAWCNDFSRLRSMLASDGGEVLVEKALAVGAVPVKIVAPTDAEDTAAHRTVRYRTLD